MPTLERPLDRFSVAALRDTITVFRDLVRTHQDAVNRLNVYPVPDGDTGTNMARTLDAVVAEVQAAPVELAATCAAISHGSLMGARGNSGVILSQIMRGVATTLRERDELDGRAVADALTAGAAAAYQAVLKPVEGTILTVVRESADGAREAADGGTDLVGVLRAAGAAGAASLARTPDLLPVLKDAGVVDAGGAGFLLLLDAARHVVAGDPLPPAPDTAGPVGATFEAVARRPATVSGELDVSEQRYEVMYLCDLADERIGDLKDRWSSIGDSIVVVGGDGIWNCHVHTNDIGAAIESALDLDGRPHGIRVTDLFEEVSAEHAAREAAISAGAAPAAPAASERPAVTCAVVAVSSGPGISTLFAELGVQAVVSGGQTLNPSTAELLAAVEQVNADHVVVLPGNKNIIPVAEQLDALTARTVRVVPTRSMPEGLAALMVYDPESGVEVNTAAMRHAAEAIAAGEVTQAVRSSQTPAGPVAAGDWLGVVRGDGIVAVAPDVLGAVTALLDRLVTAERELLTVIRGVDADDRTVAEIESWMSTSHPGVEVEVHDGGQPLYPYLFGVE